MGWGKPSRCSRVTPSSMFCCKYLAQHYRWQSHWTISSTWVSEWPPILEVLVKNSIWVVGGRTLGCSWEDVDTTWRCTASLQCGCPQLTQCCISWPLDWKGRPYSMAWPDLNPLHYFLWGYLKSLVFEAPVETDMELVARIVAACDVIESTLGFGRILYADVMLALRLV